MVGIYKIINLVNGFIYIGSSNNINRRIVTHKSKLNLNTHPNIHLQNSWNKYGNENFDFNILELCEEDNLIEKEQYYIDLLKPNYNICPIAKSSRGRPSLQETKDKISKALKGHIGTIGRICPIEEVKQRASNLKGIIKSEEFKKIIGKKNKLYNRTNEHNERLSKNSTNKRKILMIDTFTNNIIKEFDSILSAKKYVNAKTHSGIQKCCSGEREKAFGYNWKYKDVKQKVLLINNSNIIEFNSFSEIAKTFNKSRTYIKKCFDLNIPDYDGYLYKLKIDNNIKNYNYAV